MSAYHNSRNHIYREPFGAAAVGTDIKVAIDFRNELPAEVVLRIWTDGVGETRIPMSISKREGIYTATGIYTAKEPSLNWYRFEIVYADGRKAYYGAKEGRQGGEGQLYPADRDCPSYQISAYKPRKVPEWYSHGLVYQIFPDRFAREEGVTDEELESRLRGHEHGPKRRIVDWNTPVRYERNLDHSIAAWDFYGGSLKGIREKLGYLRDLGVSVIYLNPICECASNHRYDTGDYMSVDPLLGTEEDFSALCRDAEAKGISVMLDGVFNHTGCDSIYFNKYGNYESLGAYQSTDSQYRSWYSFNNTDCGYDSWWGVGDLPSLRESDKSLREFIYGGRESVVRKWLRLGAKGWRLDVADELPDEFIAGIKQAVCEEKPDEGLLMGEVWEDASNKVAYGIRRRYFQGDELDCVMNYPFRDRVCDYLLDRCGAPELAECLYTLYENYPREAFYAGLNLLGSHDTVRILTQLGGAPDKDSLSEEERAAYRLSEAQRGGAKARLWFAVLMQMTMPGVPCVYYGDEVGAEGYADPYNRAPYPWGGGDADCLNIYRNAIGLRRSLDIFADGDFEPFAADGDVLGYTRRLGDEAVIVLINRSAEYEKDVVLPRLNEYAVDLISGRLYCCGRDAGDVENTKNTKDAEDTKDTNDTSGNNESISVHLYRLGSAVIYFSKRQRLGKLLSPGTGVLCHITSLPNSTGGQGVIGDECYRFIDYLKSRGEKYWQILPLNPTDAAGSPYAGYSAFAGNIALLPYTTDELRGMYEACKHSCGTKCVGKSQRESESCNQKEPVDTGAVYRGGADADFAADTTTQSDAQEFSRFVHENAAWLDGFSMYMAVKERMQGRAWSKWNEPYREYSEELWQDESLRREADFHRYEQYILDREWSKVRRYAAERGISIIGDMAIYVSHDSADVWQYPRYFNMDEEAGVPPDCFSADGQCWGNPVYNWGELKADGYKWWLMRLERAFKLYDIVRLDHFRGFEAYWAVPRGEKSLKGHWRYGPGRELFEAAFRQFGKLPVIAEDLGYLTPGVRALVAGTGFPGMDVMQFSDTEPWAGYKPDCDRVAYTGTHDNETLLGWCRSLCRRKHGLFDEGKTAASSEAGAEALRCKLLEDFYKSDAFIKIVPLQDILGLGNEARMNTPGTVGGNWSWQVSSFD